MSEGPDNHLLLTQTEPMSTNPATHRLHNQAAYIKFMWVGCRFQLPFPEQILPLFKLF